MAKQKQQQQIVSLTACSSVAGVDIAAWILMIENVILHDTAANAVQIGRVIIGRSKGGRGVSILVLMD